MRFLARRGFAVVCWLLVAAGAARGQSYAHNNAQQALGRALRGTAGVGVVLDAGTGNVIAKVGNADALAAPGSTLKPFVLLAALEHGVVGAKTTLECRGTLTVAGRNLACTHPAALRSFTAESALAYSCNAYFAAVARRMDAEVLAAGLEAFGLRAGVRDGVRGAGATPDGRALLALGLEGIEVSPQQLASAYRRLALAMQAGGVTVPHQSALKVVERGMEGSASYGMANNATTEGVRLAGKTGTASKPGQAWTHGWFAGIVYDGRQAREIVVMYVPRGSGADAALLAHRFLLEERGR